MAYVTSRFPKLSETFVLCELLALERRGVPVDLYPLLRERARLVHPEAAPVVARARYTPFLSPAVAASQLFWLRRRPRAYLRAWYDVLTGTWGSPNFFLGALACLPKVAHAARRMQADGVTHVHCHFANHPAVAGLVVGRLTGIPFSFTAHGSDLHKDRRMLDRKVAEAAFVATVSADNRRLIVQECGEQVAAKVHVVRAGVDTRLFAPAAARARMRAADDPVRGDVARGQRSGVPRRGVPAARGRGRRGALPPGRRRATTRPRCVRRSARPGWNRTSCWPARARGRRSRTSCAVRMPSSPRARRPGTDAARAFRSCSWRR